MDVINIVTGPHTGCWPRCLKMLRRAQNFQATITTNSYHCTMEAPRKKSFIVHKVAFYFVPSYNRWYIYDGNFILVVLSNTRRKGHPHKKHHIWKCHEKWIYTKLLGSLWPHLGPCTPINHQVPIIYPCKLTQIFLMKFAYKYGRLFELK